MKLLFISHLEKGCFVSNIPEIEVEAVVDKRCLDEIFADKALAVADYDILLINPELPTDPGWRAAPVPALIFSSFYRKPATQDKVAHIPRNIVEKKWRFIIEEFACCRSFTQVLQKLQQQEKEKM